MFEMAEEKGILKPGMTVIEPTSGIILISLLFNCIIRKYGNRLGFGLCCKRLQVHHCNVSRIVELQNGVSNCRPTKMSHEKEVTVKALGAEIVRSNDDAAYDSKF